MKTRFYTLAHHKVFFSLTIQDLPKVLHWIWQGLYHTLQVLETTGTSVYLLLLQGFFSLFLFYSFRFTDFQVQRLHNLLLLISPYCSHLLILRDCLNSQLSQTLEAGNHLKDIFCTYLFSIFQFLLCLVWMIFKNLEMNFSLHFQYLNFNFNYLNCLPNCFCLGIESCFVSVLKIQSISSNSFVILLTFSYNCTFPFGFL